MVLTDWKPIKKLSSGGQGTTVLVEQGSSKERAVLKQPHATSGSALEKARARLLLEVASLRAVAALGGRVPKVLEENVSSGEASEKPYFVMEFIQGPTLDKFATESGPQPLSVAAQLVNALCDTMNHAHASGILHRDIKPNNIILSGGDPGRPVLLDFGLSTDGEQDVTETGEQVGNRFMRLPEGQIYGANHRDPRSDVTQLVGLLLYLLNGGIEPRILLDQNGVAPHRRSETAIRANVDSTTKASLDVFFDRGFAHALTSRFGSIQEMVERLGRILQPPASANRQPLTELALEATTAIRASDAGLRQKLAREEASKKAEKLRDNVAKKIGSIAAGDFQISVETRIGGGTGLPSGLLGVSHITITVKHIHSGAMYRVSYAFQCLNDIEIGLLRASHHWNDQPKWEGPRIWFTEPSPTIVSQVVEDANSEIAKGIREIQIRLTSSE